RDLLRSSFPRSAVSWESELRIGQQTGLGRLRREAQELAELIPELTPAQARAEVVARYFSSTGHDYYHDAASHRVHAPRRVVVYGDGTPVRGLNMRDPLEAEIARQHSRILVEEVAHYAGHDVRPGSYAPMTSSMRGFETWVNTYLSNPQNRAQFTA